MKYFTISEFAALRNININSLRYYERKGLLEPAYIDEQTRYRYYSAEQLSTLDAIILCIDLGIPLKELTRYADDSGAFQLQRLLVDGRRLAQQRIDKIRRTLNSVEFFLQNMEQNDIRREKGKVYERSIRRRHVIRTRLFSCVPERKQIETEVAKLYRMAQEKGLFPIMPANQLLIYESSHETQCCFFLEVAVKERSDVNISVIPEGVYPCVLVDEKPSEDMRDIIRNYWEYEKGMAVIAYNVHIEKCAFGSEPTELQLADVKMLEGMELQV